ncbi:MAG: TRAP transporter large permease [Alcaligenaceae bacterium]|nr:TRAP transporter large permease [Alcaligenaceae bacterium]
MEFGWLGLTLILFAFLLVFMTIGIPVAFSMGITATIMVFLFLNPAMLIQMARMSFVVSTSHLFLVAPLFVLMAGVVSHSDIAERSYLAATKWFNRVPGALPVSTIVACSAFAAISGSSPATAAAIGYASIPEMLRHGYSKRMAVGVVAAGGTLGILIPPSVVMVIYGILTETSIGSLFIAGIVPGLFLAALMITYVILESMREGTAKPLNIRVTWAERFSSLTGIWPVLLLFLIVMGSIYSGLATTTEAAALGALGALLLTIRRPDMRHGGLSKVLLTTAQTTTMLMMLIIFGSFFGFVVSRLGIAHGMIESVTSANLQPWMVLTLYIVVLLILGCLMDPASMMVITLPLAFPVLSKMGYDPVWLGIIVTIAVEIGMITPPVGLNLFVLKGIVPKEVTMTDIMAGSAPFILVMLLGLLVVVLFPQIALWLPQMMAK